MAQAARLNLRMQKEIKLLAADPPPGVSFPFLSDGKSTFSALTIIEARLKGPEGTVYCEGIFTLTIQIPERYPFQPPNVTFVTPIYHPNIDNGGRICLDILNLPPKGAWQPSLNISTILTSIGLLLNEPNPDDGLMAEASREYKYNRTVFDEKAQYWTQKYANPSTTEKDEGSLLPNLKMEAKQHPSLVKNSQPEVSNPQTLSDEPVDETVGSRKKLRLMGGKLSLKSAPPFRNNSCEAIQKTVPTATGRIEEDDEKIASIQTLSPAFLNKAPVEISCSLVEEKCKALQEISVDITTIIVSDSEEESDHEVGRPYKSRPFLMQKRTA